MTLKIKVYQRRKNELDLYFVLGPSTFRDCNPPKVVRIIRHPDFQAKDFRSDIGAASRHSVQCNALSCIWRMQFKQHVSCIYIEMHSNEHNAHCKKTYYVLHCFTMQTV